MDNFQKNLLEQIFKLVTILTEYTKEREESGEAVGCDVIEKEISDMTNQASIRTRANGSYELRYRRNGYQKSFYGRTKAEVNQKFQEWRKTIRNKPKPKKLPPKQITFSDWFEEYMQLYKEGKIDKKTCQNIKSLIKTAMYPTLKDMEISKITNKDIQLCINTMRAGHNSQRKMKYYIKDVFKKAIINGLTKTNPAENLTIAKPGVIRSEYLSAEQIELLESQDLSIMQNRYFLFCLYTGARGSEGLRLQLSDIDRINKTIFLRGTKTEGSKRTLPLFDTVARLFPEGENLPNLVFQGLNMTSSLKRFQRIIPDRCIKDLRTTFATVCHEKGVPPKVVQKWMGHSKVDMTMNVYTKVTSDFEFKQAEKLTYTPKNTPQN